MCAISSVYSNVVSQSSKGCHFDNEKVEAVKKIIIVEGLAHRNGSSATCMELDPSQRGWNHQI